jgi:hypothetical protein
MFEIVTALVVVMAAAAAILLPLSWLLGRMFTTEPPSASEWLRVILPTDARPAPLGDVVAAARSSFSVVLPWSSVLWIVATRGVLYGVGLIGAAYMSAAVYILVAVALYVFFGL